VWLIALNSRGVRRLLAAISALAVLLVTAQTGSRGTIVAVIGMAMLIFLKSSFTSKLKLGLIGFVLLASVFSALPDELQRRYLTLLPATAGSVEPSEASLLDSAVASREQR